MRVAVVSDVHGNLPALEAVLAEIEREGVDLVVSGGDVGMGPMPAECVDALLALDRVLWVRGNADREAVPERYEELARWVAERLGPERRQLLAGAPLTAAVDVDGLGPVLCFHGTPRSDEEILTKLSPEHRIAEALDSVEQRVVVHGHTHVQYDREVAGRRVVNVGSVGIPYEGRRGAFWALLGPDVELRRTEYDVEAAVAAVRATGYPAIDEFAGWLLDPPDPDEISAFFEGHATGA
jgi:putative phosphoesterase